MSTVEAWCVTRGEHGPCQHNARRTVGKQGEGSPQGAEMLIVADDTPRNERELKAGEMACPDGQRRAAPLGACPTTPVCGCCRAAV